MAENISKKEFLSVYNSNKPNFWIKFIYKYFSKGTSKDKLIPKKVIVAMLSLFFFLGFFGTAFNAKYELIKIVTIAYSILLSVVGLSIVSAVIMNNLRIRKTAKELNITIEKYEELLKLYF